MTDDAELLRRYSEQRSEEAFADLVRRHLNLVYRSALRRMGGDAYAAEDIAQKVFSSLARQAPQLLHRASLEGWLFTTTRNLAAYTIRSESRRRAREYEASLMDESSPEPLLDCNQLWPVIDQLLDRLGERDRELVLFRFFHGAAYADIGVRFGLTTDAARFRVNRALEKMRAALGKRGAVSTSAALAATLSSQASTVVQAEMVAMVTKVSLAQAAHAGSSAALTIRALQFMSINKTAVGVGLLLVCIAGGLLVREHAALVGVETAFSSAESGYNAAIKQLADDKIALSVAELDRVKALKLASDAAAQATREASSMSTVGSANGGASAIPISAKPQQVNRELSHNPEVRAALSTWIKSAYQEEFGAFYRSTGLSPQQIASLENLLMENNINMGSALLTLRPDDKSVGQVQQDIHQLLGDANYQLFLQNQQTGFVRVLASGLAASLYDSPTPLTAQQGERLTQILAQSNPQYQQGGKIWVFPSMVDWDSALTQAQGVLSPTQLEALRNESVIISNNAVVGGINGTFPGAFGNGTAPPRSIFAPDGASK